MGPGDKEGKVSAQLEVAAEGISTHWGEAAWSPRPHSPCCPFLHPKEEGWGCCSAEGKAIYLPEKFLMVTLGWPKESVGPTYCSQTPPESSLLLYTFPNLLKLCHCNFTLCSYRVGFRNAPATSPAPCCPNLSKFKLTFRQITSHVDTNTVVAGQTQTAWAAGRQSLLTNSVEKMNLGIWVMTWKNIMLH